MDNLDAQDELVNFKDFLETCVNALLNPEGDKKQVAHTLFFVGIPFIDKVIEGLKEHV